MNVRVLLVVFGCGLLIGGSQALSFNQFKKFCEKHEECDEETLEEKCEEDDDCKELLEECKEDPKACKKSLQEVKTCLKSNFNAAGCDEESMQKMIEAAEAEFAEEDNPKCFHGSTMVQTNLGQFTMENLAKMDSTGVKVLSWDRLSQTSSYSPLRVWTHANPNTEVDYVQVELEGGNKLLISPLHLIYRSPDCEQKNSQVVFASRLREGECLFTGKDMNTEKIAGIQTTRKAGFYSLVTEAGSVVVNGIAASCFTDNENEELSKMAFGYMLKAADILKTFLPSSWIRELFWVTSTGEAVPQQQLGPIVSAFTKIHKSVVHSVGGRN
jgi:hypothetical protein